MAAQELTDNLRRLADPRATRSHAAIFENITVTGVLDLSRSVFDFPVVFRNCSFSTDVVLEEASFAQLSLAGSKIGGDGNGKLRAAHVDITSGDLDLRSLEGVVCLSGAHIRDDVHLQGAVLGTSSTTVSLEASNLHLKGSFFASESRIGLETAARQGEKIFMAPGGILLDNAHIGGSLYLSDAHVGGTDTTYSIYGDGMKLDGEFQGYGLVAQGVVSLVGALLGDSLVLRDADLKPGRESEASREGLLLLDRGKMEGSVFLDGAFRCPDTVHAVNCRIGGSLSLQGADLTTRTEKKKPFSVILNHASIGSSVQMDTWKGRGAVRPFRASGAVGMICAHVVDEIHLDVSSIDGPCRPSAAPTADLPPEHCLVADLAGLQTSRIFLVDPPRGEVSEKDEEVSGKKEDTRGAIAESGPEVAAARILDFTQVRVVALYDSSTMWDRNHAVLRGFDYQMINNVDVTFEKRLAWAREGSRYSRSKERSGIPDEHVSYHVGPPAPQPYEKLASVLRAAGQDDDARTVLMHKLKDAETYRRSSSSPRRKGIRGFLGWWGKWTWNELQFRTIGYGYRPGLAFLIILFLWGAGVALFWLWPPNATKGQGSMTYSEHLAYPMDLLIPLVGLGEKDRWHPAGQLMDACASFLVIAGWLLSAVVVAAAARTLRRQ